MSKQISMSNETREIVIDRMKNPPDLDDKTIREVVRSGCPELQEEIPMDLMAGNLHVLVVQTLPLPAEPNWIDPHFLKDKTDLILLWGLYAQRQVITFDQESQILYTWEDQPAW